MTDATTPEMQEFQTQVYQGAADAGMDLSGRSDWAQLHSTLAGTTDGPGVDIGVTGELTVAVDASGQLVDQARFRSPGGPDSTHLLKIYVNPFVEFGTDGNVPHIRWLASVQVTALSKNRIVMGEDSADEKAINAQQGGRPYVEYMNDPDYQQARLDFHHDTPGEAVRVALEKISSGGVINLPNSPKASERIPAQAVDSSDPRKKGAIIAAGVLIAAVAAVVLLISSGSEPDATATNSEPTPEATAAAPQPTTAPQPTAAPEPTTAPAEEPEPEAAEPEPEPTAQLDSTELPVMDIRCFVVETGEALDEGCSQLTSITRTGDNPVTLSFGGPDDLGFGPDSSVTLSLYLSDGPANDVLIECTSNASAENSCNSWAAPSFFGVTADWVMSDYFSLATDLQMVFQLFRVGDSGAGFELPEGEVSDGTKIPAGQYRVTEASVFVEVDGVRTIFLFANAEATWF